jgi:siroheme synthase-like protein
VKGLLEAGARVTLVSPALAAEPPAGRLDWKERRFRLSDLAGQFLVYAATNDRKVNARIARECQRRGILVNVADAPDECDFIVPARVRRPGFVLAISTEGKQPRAAAELRRRLEELF